jgi:hypothetical protein
MSDWQRIVRFLQEHPGSSVQEIRFGLFVSNVTGRMSDARKHGHEFIQWRDDKGTFRYRVKEPRLLPLRGEQESLAW